MGESPNLKLIEWKEDGRRKWKMLLWLKNNSGLQREFNLWGKGQYEDEEGHNIFMKMKHEGASFGKSNLFRAPGSDSECFTISKFWLPLSIDPSVDQEKTPLGKRANLKESPSWGIPLPGGDGVSVKLIFDEKQLAVDWILMLLGYSIYSTEILRMQDISHVAVVSKSKWKCR